MLLDYDVTANWIIKNERWFECQACGLEGPQPEHRVDCFRPDAPPKEYTTSDGVTLYGAAGFGPGWPMMPAEAPTPEPEYKLVGLPEAVELVMQYGGGSWQDFLAKLERVHGVVLVRRQA